MHAVHSAWGQFQALTAVSAYAGLGLNVDAGLVWIRLIGQPRVPEPDCRFGPMWAPHAACNPDWSHALCVALASAWPHVLSAGPGLAWAACKTWGWHDALQAFYG